MSIPPPSPSQLATAFEPKQTGPDCDSTPRITAEKTAPHRLSGDFSFEDMAQITLDAIGDAVLVVDPQSKVIYLNKVAQTFSGWSSEEALGRHVDEVFFIVDGNTRERAISPAQRAISEGRTVALALGSVLIRRDGSDMAIEDSAAPIHNRLGQVAGAVIVFHDGRQSETVRQKMSYLAHHDFLTGLPNRVLLAERFTHAIGMAKRHDKQLALLFLDLDGFKKINDAWGHAVGDQLLRNIAAKIETCVRATDTVSRHGGDEFVILLTEIEAKQDAAKVAQKLLAAFAVPDMIDGQEFKVNVSIGISVYPEDGGDPETLMGLADKAMYRAKGVGRGIYQFWHRTEKRTVASPAHQSRRQPAPPLKEPDPPGHGPGAGGMRNVHFIDGDHEGQGDEKGRDDDPNRRFSLVRWLMLKR